MDAAELFKDARVQTALQPVSDQKPAGVSIRDEAEYEALDNEVRRMEVDGPDAVNWNRLSQDGLKLLSTRSKDMMIACWVSYGIMKQDGLKGLGIGLTLIKGMINGYWEGLTPPLQRERARAMAIEWFVRRAAPLLPTEDPGPSQWVYVRGCYDLLFEISDIVREKFTKEQVEFSGLVQALRPLNELAKRGLAGQAEEQARRDNEAAERERMALEEQKRAEERQKNEEENRRLAAEQGGSVSSPPSSTYSGGGGGTLSPQAMPLDALPDQLFNYAFSFIETDLFDPRAFILTRTASWMRLPPVIAHNDGQTMLPSPAQEIANLQMLKNAGQHRDVILACERTLWNAPFALDVHQIAFESLGSFGAQAEPAQAAIAGMLAGHFNRFPDFLKLSFSDGTPFVSPDLQEWITSKGLQGGGGAPSGGGGGGADIGAKMLAEARNFATRGDQIGAFDLLTQTLRKTVSGRDRLKIQMAQVAFCMEANLVVVALPIIENALETVDAYKLEVWEPDLASEISELYFRAVLVAGGAGLFTSEEERVSQLSRARARLSRQNLAAITKLLI